MIFTISFFTLINKILENFKGGTWLSFLLCVKYLLENLNKCIDNFVNI